MDQPDRVALLVTCLVDQLMPEVGVATVKLLRRAGCQVEFPAGQTCCGQPFFNSGYQKQATGLARRTIEIFEPYERVVLPSGSCTSMIRLEYPHLFEGSPEWQKRAKELGEKTYELSEFLTQKTSGVTEDREESKQVTSRSVTYHDSCHMRRLLGLKQEPRQLLEGSGCTIKEMTESDRCCGFGGLFSARMPEVSTAMTAEKLRLAAGSEATTLVTADPGCLMQMRGLAGKEVKIEHLAVILEEMTRHDR